MSSLNFLAGVIAKRLGHSLAGARAIAETLSEDERELVELACTQHGGTVQIAAVIHNARLRQAAAIADPCLRREVECEARIEAAHHYRMIRNEPAPQNFVDTKPPLRTLPGIRVVPPPSLDPRDADAD